jgi:hypothetical protein
MTQIKVMRFYQDKEDEQEYPDCYQLIADFDKREISTNCGDYYYDLTFNFDDFIRFAEHVKEQDKIYNSKMELEDETTQ